MLLWCAEISSYWPSPRLIRRGGASGTSSAREPSSGVSLREQLKASAGTTTSSGPTKRMLGDAVRSVETGAARVANPGRNNATTMNKKNLSRCKSHIEANHQIGSVERRVCPKHDTCGPHLGWGKREVSMTNAEAWINAWPRCSVTCTGTHLEQPAENAHREADSVAKWRLDVVCAF